MNGKENQIPGRRRFVALLAVAGATILGLKGDVPGTRNSTIEIKPWPTDEEGILNRIKEIKFAPGSEVGITAFFRKWMWETAETEKILGVWKGGDESDWMGRQSVIKEQVEILAKAGVNSARLVVVPFEITEDGEKYNWEPMETAIEILSKSGIKVNLAVGPLDFPYNPGGRLPKIIIEMMAESKRQHINISMRNDSRVPEIDGVIRNFGMDYLNKLIKRYGHDTRINEFCWGNEWPDTDEIEGIRGKITIEKDFVMESIRRIKEQTDKRIVFNTNIHPHDTRGLKSTYGDIMKMLGKQGGLGFDTYPSREDLVFSLRQANKNYGGLIDRTKEMFPLARLGFEEIEAQPWPPDNIAGKPWSEIYKNYKEEIIQPFFTRQLPPTLETHIAASGLKKNSFWGAELWLVMKKMGNDFPLQMIKTIAETMKDSK